MKIFGKPYAEKFVANLSADAKASFAAALDDNGDFLRIDLDLGPTALQETYDEDECAKCALSYGGKELQGVIHYASDEEYEFVSYEPQDALRFWEIDAETCELVEILTHEDVTLQDLRIALASGISGSELPARPSSVADKTYHLVLDDGTLGWHEGNGLYLHTIVFDVGLSNSFTIRLISDSATPCAKDTTTGNFGIAGATFVNRANMDNIVLRPFGANQFNPDVYAFDTETGTYSDQFTLADVTSDTVTPIK